MFFGRETTQLPELAVEELYVTKTDTGIQALFDRDDDEWSASLDDAGHLTPTKPRRDPLSLTLYEDGSFDGEVRYTDGSKALWARTPYIPASETLLAEPTGFAGFVAGAIRYRIKIGAQGETVSGVARYSPTRRELGIRGRLDRASRQLTADEVDESGHTTGHIDAALLGHVRAAPYSTSLSLLGTWTSPDGKRRLPIHLDAGYYPDRIVLPAGRALSAQDIYTRDCEYVNEVVYPVVDGAPKSVSNPLDALLRSLTFTEGVQPLAGMAPQSWVKRERCSADPDRRGTNSAVYSATALWGSSVAVEIEHYRQEGPTSGGVWTDCVVVNLSTGESIVPAKLLDATARATLTERARKEAVSHLAKLSPKDSVDRDLDEGMRQAATELSLEDVPLCIEEHSVRFALVSHRVFGPAQPVFDRAVVAEVLPAGPLRDLVDPKAH